MSLPLSRSGRSILEIVTQAVEEAGEALLTHFHTEIKIKSKGRGNLVSRAENLKDLGIQSSKQLPESLKAEGTAPDEASRITTRDTTLEPRSTV